MSAFPRHIAVIMDGNGRWANKRGLPRIAGHKKGVESTRAIVRHAGEIGLEYLTLYAFSTENWKRSDGEISDLMGLLRFYLKSEASDLHKNNVRLRVLGARDRLSSDILELIDHVEDLSKDNTGLQLNVALDYGARQEIVHAVQALIRKHDGNEISEDMVSMHLFTRELPDPDLVIRTSGEQRISNFLLWQIAYSEFIFTDTLWPDFTPSEFDACIADYQERDRRFGDAQEGQAG